MKKDLYFILFLIILIAAPYILTEAMHYLYTNSNIASGVTLGFIFVLEVMLLEYILKKVYRIKDLQKKNITLNDEVDDLKDEINELRNRGHYTYIGSGDFEHKMDKKQDEDFAKKMELKKQTRESERNFYKQDDWLDKLSKIFEKK
jgi:SMC interacting uncharacterized protein involved in chromosome segregation